MLWWCYQIYCLAPAVDHKGGGNCVCPPCVEVFTSQWYQKVHYVPVLRKLISALGAVFPLEHHLERTVHCSIWDSWHITGKTYFSTWRLSICLVKVYCYSQCVAAFAWSALSFVWNWSTNGAGVLLFACFPAKFICCLPVVFILCGCVCINTFSCFKCYWNQGV